MIDYDHYRAEAARVRAAAYLDVASALWKYLRAGTRHCGGTVADLYKKHRRMSCRGGLKPAPASEFPL
jgi:hypothetical protein